MLAHRGLDAARTPVGTRVSHEGESVTATVRRTGRPARIDDYSDGRPARGARAGHGPALERLGADRGRG